MISRPNPTAAAGALKGAEGELVCVAIVVEPRRLEALLDALRGLDFPVNPQIYHRASVTYLYHDGRRRIESAVIVEFPAYAGRLKQVRELAEKLGLPAEAMAHAPMLESIRAGVITSAGPPGSPYLLIMRFRTEGGRKAASSLH